MNDLTLYTPIKAGYKDAKYQKKELSKFGYVRDDVLSNDNSQTYYNPTQNKLLFNVTGTHNLSDVATDISLFGGYLKGTSRYKEAKTKFEESKKKYGTYATITAHSLGGIIGSNIDDENDRIFTLDKATLPFQKSHKNENNYRIEGDVVSLFGANAKHTTNLNNPNKNNILPNILTAHDVQNIKGANIYI